MSFQFTHPGKGATHKPLVSAQRDVGFNSRTLGRVRQVGAEAAYLPLAFQFTHPGKGATLDNGSLTHDAAVSIHAPWEGCDICKPAEDVAEYLVSIHAPWEGCDPRCLAIDA